MKLSSWLTSCLSIHAVVMFACTHRPPGSAPSPSSAGDETIITDVRVFDGERVIPNASVVMRGGFIVAVAEQVPVSPGATVVDGRGKTLLPGLIDAHAHVWEVGQLQASARFGVTTVLDMMTDWRTAQRLEEEAQQNPTIADLRSAGNPVTIRGGHGTEYPLEIETLDEAKEAEAFVTRRVEQGSDYLKIMYTPDSPLFPSIDRETLEASVAQAHAHDLRAVVHVDTLLGATHALQAGADGLAHLFYDAPASEAFVRVAKERAAFVVPTLSVLRSAAGTPPGPSLAEDEALASRLDERLVSTLNHQFPIVVEVDERGLADSVSALRRAGVALLAGTDAPNPGTAHGVSMHGELELLVEHGLSPIEALVAATSAPADAFALNDRGRIAPGLQADLLLVDGDPTRDVRASRNIVAVWRGGTRLEVEPIAWGPSPAQTDLPPPTREAGLISNFETDIAASTFGSGWSPSTDAIAGGKSSVALRSVRPGARDSSAALAIEGEVAAGLPFAWSGVMFNPGDRPFSPADLSASQELVFSARGDGKAYSVLLFTVANGATPFRQHFVAASAWTQHRLPLSAFEGADLREVTGIAFVAGPKPRHYMFALDDVQLRSDGATAATGP